MGDSLKFKHSDNDIILGNPRYIALNDGSRVLLHALPISKIDKFLVLFCNGIGDDKLLHKLIKCGSNQQKIYEFIYNELELISINGNSYFKKFDFVSAYYSIHENKLDDNGKLISMILSPESAINALVTIIEQNQLIDLLSTCLNFKETTTRKKYTSSFSLYQIIELGLVEGLNLVNANDKLTIEQRDFYLDIADLKLKKQTEYMHLALSIAVANGLGSKIDFQDVLFPIEKSNDKFKNLEEKRKLFLCDKYTGDKNKDDALIKQIMDEKKDNSISKFLYESYTTLD